MLRKFVLALVMVVSIAVPAGAAEPFIALVDLERGLLLIPEGTAVPAGVEFYLEPDNAPARRSGPWIQDGAAERTPMFGAVEGAAERRRLVYAYAPAERFVAPRQRIHDTRPRELETDVADVDHIYYFYFYDGSYHGARKIIRNLPGLPYDYNVQFGVETLAYTTDGDFDSKITVSQANAQYAYWTGSNTCWFYGVDGSCSTSSHSYQTNANFTGNVTSKASIVHYFYPPCNLPCKANLSSSIVIYFP